MPLLVCATVDRTLQHGRRPQGRRILPTSLLASPQSAAAAMGFASKSGRVKTSTLALSGNATVESKEDIAIESVKGVAKITSGS